MWPAWSLFFFAAEDDLSLKYDLDGVARVRLQAVDFDDEDRAFHLAGSGRDRHGGCGLRARGPCQQSQDNTNANEGRDPGLHGQILCLAG